MLSDDSHAIVLLCSHLARPRDGGGALKPLSVVEWSRLAVQVVNSEWRRPAALLGRTVPELREALDLDQQLAERVAALLGRGGQVAIELERLANRGIWVLTRADEAYPTNLKERLGHKAPAVLFGAGPVELLSSNGLAVVGSRDVDAAGSSFASEVGMRCAEAGITVFSGAARGVDRQAMLASVEHAGTAVGVPADSLERMLRDRDYGSHIRQRALTLATPFVPSAPFSVANAMSRNKLVYCLANYAIVVSSSEQNGGTWAGAIENLRSGWVPLFVRNGPDSPKGNQELVDQGGIPLSSSLPSQGTGLLAWLKAAEHEAHGKLPAPPPRSANPANHQIRLFGDLGAEPQRAQPEPR